MQKNEEMQEVHNLIRNTICFSAENLKLIKAYMRNQILDEGSYLFWEDDLVEQFYYIINGQIKVTKTNTEGKEFILYIFQSGDFLGNLDPFNHSKQSFNAEAMEPTEIGVIQKSDIEQLLSENNQLTIEFMKWIGLMHRITQTKFRDLMLYGKKGALCSTLIRLANSFGREDEHGILITEKLTNHDLADYIGAARENVNRMLADLKKSDVLETEEGFIRIKKIDVLKEICQCENCPIEICRM